MDILSFYVYEFNTVECNTCASIRCAICFTRTSFIDMIICLSLTYL